MSRNLSQDGLSFSNDSSMLDPAEDFVSFPTLPDPEVVANRSISNMLQKTLRKVTNNASNLVHSYTSPGNDHAPNNGDIIESQSIYNPDVEAADAKTVDVPEVPESAPAATAAAAARDPPKKDVKELGLLPMPGTPALLSPSDLKSPPVQQISEPVIGPHATATPSDSYPRVISDKRFLTISTVQYAPQAPSAINKSDVTVVNTESTATPSTPLVDPTAKSPDSGPELVNLQLHHSSKTKPLMVDKLKNQISSIFNNLPNDIEVSDDDSASEPETTDIDSIPAPRSKSGSVSSKSKVSKQIQPRLPRTPPHSHAVVTNPLTRKISANLSSAFIDSAKSIMTTNLIAKSTTGSSKAGSLVENKKKKKKKRPHRLSDNPLKSGGIAKHYWMNDSFVSDCLNCFKPFTAFRRKHHCRFCGQIFCADCTIFISYSHYKDQRSGVGAGKDIKSYKDKLRVCKPCYCDVIVYLSDDSSESSSEEEEEAVSNTPGEFSDFEDNAHASVQSLTRLRSYSLNSSRDAAFESPLSSTRKNLQPDELRSDATSSMDFNSQRSPDAFSHRHPPQMAIPTTRTGEAVEIPASKYGHGSLPKGQLVLSPARPAMHQNMSYAKQDSLNWYYPKRAASVSSDLGQSSNYPNLENFSSIYKAVVNNRYSRIPSSERLKPTLIRSEDEGVLEPEEDFESENEDENVMSLYASLNHENPSSLGSRPHNPLAVSMTGVPTLSEFPAMSGKYIPANLSQEIAMKRFEFKPIDSFSDATINENKQRSNYRSNERAKASLRRIKDRRNHKSGKRGYGGTLPIAGNNPSLDGSVSSPFNTPLSTTPLSFARKFSDPFLTPRTKDTTLKELSRSTTGTPSLGIPDETLAMPAARKPSENSHSEKQDWRTNPMEEDPMTVSYNMNINKMIRQCLADCDIKNPEEQDRWARVFRSIFSNIEHLKVIDTLDVKQYIKIKKILGGSIEDTKKLDGLFITKNIDSKRMHDSIDNPKIALLVFPLEYLKQKEQFISLRIVQSQQSMYISNLVSRLISLEPDILIVGDTVCGFAEKLLEEANITVISNVKPQVIERISRYTKGDILQSVNDLFFKKGTLGTCEKFEVKKFVYKDVVKTYAYFLGSQLESGFTICLRGGDEEYLSSAKYAVESLIPGVFNSKFEKSFFHDFDLTISKDREVSYSDLFQGTLEVDNTNDQKAICVKSLKQNGVINYLELFNERILNFSPSVEYPLPSALNNVITSFKNFAGIFEFNKQLQLIDTQDEIRSEWFDKLQFNLSLDRFIDKGDIIQTLKFVSQDLLNFHLQEFHFRSRIWVNCSKYTIYQLYPIFHKNINFLHSRISIKHATPCYGPMVVAVDYYSDNDKCLGVFLDQILQESNKSCDECGDLLLNHYNTYAHGNAKIDLIVEKIEDMNDQTKEKKQRIMWSYCPQCNISTPIKAMSNETYFLSLGKFLELNFLSKSTQVNGTCPHDFNKEHIKYFGFNGYYIRMESSKIDTYEVVVPKTKLEFMVLTDVESKISTREHIQESSSKFFKSVSKRLNRVKVDTSDQAEAGHQRVEELKQRLKTQEEYISQKTINIYEATIPTNYLSLNVINRDIQELGVAWDKEFNDFENMFLPTENEINKITQFHLRNFLMDTLDTESKQDKDMLREQEAEVNQEPKKDEPKNVSSDLGEKVVTTPTRRVPSAIIGDKIMQIQQSLEEDQNKHFLKSPSKMKSDSLMDFNFADYNKTHAPKRVSDLTNYFNQMTLEFQKQREKVLEKQSNKYKAVPIVNSQPIVEIYDNIEDVVDVENKQTSKLNLSEESSENTSQNNVDVDQAKKQVLTDLKNKDVMKGKIDIPQPEKNSLLKSLTNFWADRSATLWEPLEYPLDFTEHTFADSDVIVREDEPSSLVAFCLSTADYKQKVMGMATNFSADDDTSENMESNEQFRKKSHHFTKIEKKFKKRSDKNPSQQDDLESIMIKPKFNHLKYQFTDGSTEMSCKIFYSEQFDAFRRACGVDESFVQSLSRCIKWNSTGGKSGSNFLKTLDNRYIVKELSKSELESFVSIAPFYFRYISQSTFNTLTTAIAKIFGFYQVEFKNSMNGKTFKMDFLIMENLFYNRKTTRIFDLKGSMRNRHVKQTGKENEVLLDENMIEYIYESPVFVKEQSKKLLKGSLFNDTAFLSAMDVMDYSLVIGIDDAAGKLYVGIIDWLRTFTWDKKVENWVKGNSLVGKKGKDPTIVTPKQYRIRFREAMDRYILEVPDIWYEGSK